MDRWSEELGPGAIGFVGSTGGVTDDGEFIVLARFESEDAAQKNSQRPEQDAWFKEFSTHLDGEPTFMNSTDIDEWRVGAPTTPASYRSSPAASRDKEKVRQMFTGMDDEMAKLRPDVIGGLVVWDGNDFVQSVYFTSEKEAREGERRRTYRPKPRPRCRR